ncbi:hypothetical protein HOY82DRAFT_542425 [Tuber indicum]|nr:hypothetical protein HOY82DRAFT_542425 [Tuber indicum]
MVDDIAGEEEELNSKRKAMHNYSLVPAIRVVLECLIGGFQDEKITTCHNTQGKLNCTTGRVAGVNTYLYLGDMVGECGKSNSAEPESIVSSFTIKNHNKEGCHWYEMRNLAETRSFGYGLLLLLPVHLYQDLARKTSNLVRSFLLHQIPRMIWCVTDPAHAFQLIIKAIQSEGNVSDSVSLLGYQLTVPIDAHKVTSKDFDAYIYSYPNFNMAAILNTIQRYGGSEDAPLIEENLPKRRETVVIDLEESSEILEEEDELTSSGDEEKQGSSAQEVDAQSTMEKMMESDQKLKSMSEHFCWWTIDGRFASITEINLLTSSGKSIMNTKEAEELIKEQPDNLSSALDKARKTTSENVEADQNLTEGTIKPVIVVYATIKVQQSSPTSINETNTRLELDTGIQNVAPRGHSDTAMTMIEDMIPEMSEIMAGSCNEIPQGSVESDEDILSDLCNKKGNEAVGEKLVS